MPGGLQEVVQPVGADTSRYKSEWLSVLPVLNQVSAAQKEIIGQAGDIAKAMQAMHGAGGGAAAASDIGKMNAAIRDQLAALREVRPAVAAAQQATGDYASVVKYLGDTHADLAPLVRLTTAAIGDHAASVGRLTQVTSAATDAVADHAVVLQRAADAHGSGSQSVLSYVDSLGLLRDRARETTSALGDTAAAVTAATTAAGSSSGGSATASVLGDALAARVLAGLRGGGGGGGGGTWGPAVWGPYSGGGGTWGPMPPGGGHGGGGGGGGGFLGGAAGAIAGGGNFGRGGSAAAGDLVTGFLGTWVPRIHYAMMATNEILSTVGPAVVAGAAAAAVGMEGAQTAYGRMSAVNAVGQSLGPALGQTPGQFLGLGNTLQKAQTQADPMVWSLMGAAKNSMLAGGMGGAFSQMGMNTISMVDAFAGKVTAAFQKGAGNQITGLVSQGTNYLKQFGDIAGNIGQTFLHVAPVLPGVGGDLLSTLQGATRALSVVTGAVPPSLLGMGLAAEAGARYGPGLVGSVGNYLGRAPGRILGITAGTAATAADVAAGRAAAVGDTMAGTGVAGALGATGPLQLAAAAALAYGVGKVATAQTPRQQWIGQLQSQANQANLSQSFGDLLSNIGQFGNSSGGPQGLSPGSAMWQGAVSEFGHGNIIGGAREQWQGFLSALGLAPGARTDAGSSNVAMQNAAKQFNDLLAAGPAMQKMLGGGSMSNAYNMADMAGITASQLQQIASGTPAQKAAIKAQLENAQAGYTMMASSPGVYGANVNAVQAMKGLSGTQLGTVNSAWDQVLQNATAGTAGAAGFAGGLQNFQQLGGSLKALQEQAAVAKLTPSGLSTSNAAIAKALTGFASPAAQAAWAAYSSPSTTNPGLIQQAGSMGDWMRTAMTVSGGKVGQGDFNQVLGYQAKSLLPYAKSSPAALAQLGVLSQEMGGPAYDPLKTQAQNYKAISKSIDTAAGSAQQYNAAVNKATIATAGVSQQALNFGSTMKQNAYSALAGGSTSLPKIAQDRQSFLDAFPGGGKISPSALADAKALAKDFASVQASPKDIGAIVPQMLQGKGLTPGTIGAITGKIQQQTITYTSKVEPPHMPAAPKPPAVDYTTRVQKPVAPPAPKGGAVDYPSKVEKPVAPPAPKGGTVVYTSVVLPPGGGPAAGGAVGGGNMRLTGMASGGLVPGTGSGDIVPAMLTPGEVVIPRSLVSQLAPFLAAHGVPGFGSPAGSGSHFAAGGLVGGGTSLAQITAQISAVWQQIDALYAAEKTASGAALAQMKSQVRNLYSSQLDPLYAQKDALKSGGASTATQAAAQKAAGTFVTSVSGEIAKAMDTPAGGAKIAQSLISQIGTAMNYARGVSASTQSGLNLGGMTAGVGGGDFAGVAAPGSPGYNQAKWNAYVSAYASGTPQAPSVQDQMSSYLGSVKSFTGDLRTLSAQHLNKGILSQMIGAGPVQGDSLAQSIMGSTGGVKLANSLYSQIGKASNALGAQAAMSMYPGVKVAPNLQSASASTSVAGVGGKTAEVTVKASGVAAVQSAINSIQGKTVTINVQALGAGIASKGMQTGGLVPGGGYGDIVPAMLEPGEAVIPRSLVPALSPLLRQLGVPGFNGAMDWAAFNKHMGLGNAGSGGGGGGGNGAPNKYQGAPPAGMSWLQWIFQGTQFKNNTQPGLGSFGGLSGGTGHSLSIGVSVDGSTLNLTRAHISDIAAKVQAELLKQARVNPGTGLQLSGKGA